MSPRKQIVLALVLSLFIVPISIGVSMTLLDFTFSGSSGRAKTYKDPDMLKAIAALVVLERLETLQEHQIIVGLIEKRSIENARY